MKGMYIYTYHRLVTNMNTRNKCMSQVSNEGYVHVHIRDHRLVTNMNTHNKCMSQVSNEGYVHIHISQASY